MSGGVVSAVSVGGVELADGSESEDGVELDVSELEGVEVAVESVESEEGVDVAAVSDDSDDVGEDDWD